jgi:gamma-glutamylcyclotransferase (GGCT)/AIG2-like uncharacterized protein YtfP
MKFYLTGVCLLLSLSACSKTAPDLAKFKPGVVDNCRAYPQFLNKTGLGMPIAFDSRQRGYMGLRLLQPTTGKFWADPSWDDAGHIGAFTRDKVGNVYIAPTPEINLHDNPPALQNRIYKIDSQTGQMQAWLELPAAKLPTANNPFGVMGLFYDCDTNSLYASSVAGSEPTQILGRLYRIDLNTQKIIDQIEQVDALSIGIFNDINNKRLYFGSARSSDIYSLILDNDGNFTQQVRHEFALALLPNGNSSSARKFIFTQNKAGQFELNIKEAEFGFRLTAENNPVRRTYHFIYNAINNNWQYSHNTLEIGEQ